VRAAVDLASWTEKGREFFMASIKSELRGLFLGYLAGKHGKLARNQGKVALDEGEESEQVISTQGFGEVRIVPDSLRADIVVEADAATLAEARSEANDKMENVLSGLRALEIPNLTLRTQTLSFQPIFREQKRGETGLPEIIGYRATNSVLVTVRGASAEKLGEVASQIIDSALDAGATMAGGLGFFVDDPSPARAQALKLAVKDAEQNARAMAAAAAVTLGAPISLDGSAGRPAALRTYGLESFAAIEGERAGTPVEIGETTISASVSARFHFMSP
jgi:hypothetical protein